MTETLQGAAATRQAIIDTALRLFGEYGYNAVSTRKIAEHANANIGSIAYHFGGKPGLLRACALYVIEAAEESLGKGILDAIPDDMLPEEARTDLIHTVLLMVTPITGRDDAEAISTFMMRHLAQPSDAFDLIYDQYLAPLHKHLQQLLARAAHRDPESEETRVLTFTLLGQSMYFRLCRHIVRRSMHWESFGPAECSQVRAALEISINSLIDAYALEPAA
ncbi:CerR family C-terminal domain-containing protein [Martelella endophytica]|uniref:HTH tetR-type domain-containing protein n=1 Tax=Martelella endophytica TaxID=1486262 RepID=A0A0D5LQD2_MAREN|nr:CerR family C-terminal domain-containing protein [Martelella endophytica]AJY45967.1 hypothetical protein TM49_10270 [Martelella endophytica]